MKKIVTTLGLGLVIWAMGMNVFANEKENTQDVNLNNQYKNEASFKVLNQETSSNPQINTLDNNENNDNYTNRGQYMNQGSCCNYNNSNIYQ